MANSGSDTLLGGAETAAQVPPVHLSILYHSLEALLCEPDTDL